MKLKPIIIAMAIAIVATVILSSISAGQFDIDVITLVIITAACLLTASASTNGESPAIATEDSKATSPNNEQPADQDSPSSNGPREEGQVKWFNVSKGFGFITRDQGEDIFVHFRSIRGQGHRTLSEGQRVEYAVVEGTKGLQAEDVVTLGQAKR